MQLGKADIPKAIEHAVALHRGGRIDEAEKIYRDVLDLSPTNSEALNLLGLVHYQKRDAAGAAELIRRAIEQDAGQAKYHTNLGTALAALGRTADAEAAYRAALGLDPDHAEAHANLGGILERMGELDGAVHHCRRAAELRPGSAVAHNNLGNALQMRGEHGGAAEAYLRALAVEPAYADALCNLGITRLRLREAAKALEAFDAALRLDATNRRALAWRAVARHEVGGGDSSLARLNETIESVALGGPAPYDGLEQLNEALAREVTGHPSLAWQPGGKTTRNGRQTGNLLETPGEAVRTLETAVRQAVDAYVSKMRAAAPGDLLDGYFARVPERYVLRMWGTVLSDQGHQLAHIHPAGWISGVYYVAVPRTIGREATGGPDEGRAESHAGWIEFGQPGYGVPCDRPVETRLFRPEPGTALLFPSFLFHRTIPFAGEEGHERISIAFDVYAAR